MYSLDLLVDVVRLEVESYVDAANAFVAGKQLMQRDPEAAVLVGRNMIQGTKSLGACRQLSGNECAISYRHHVDFARRSGIWKEAARLRDIVRLRIANSCYARSRETHVGVASMDGFRCRNVFVSENTDGERSTVRAPQEAANIQVGRRIYAVLNDVEIGNGRVILVCDPLRGDVRRGKDVIEEASCRIGRLDAAICIRRKLFKSGKASIDFNRTS
jgi:hypothetical protein